MARGTSGTWAGYATADGRHVRWRTFFRADSLHRLTKRDQQVLLGHRLRSVIDLRQSHELAVFPNVFADSTEVSYHHHNVVGDEPLPDPPVVGTPADQIFASYSPWLRAPPGADRQGTGDDGRAGGPACHVPLCRRQGPDRCDKRAAPGDRRGA